MVSITLSVPHEMKHEMEEFPEINWSEVARQAIKRKISLMERFKDFTKDSEFTKQDALDLGSQLSKKVMKKHRAK